MSEDAIDYESLFEDAFSYKDLKDLPSIIQEIKNTPQRYNFIEALDEGGMKKIQLYEDRLTSRQVARGELKTLDPDKLERFVNEIRITAKLEHPNIMPIYDMGLNKQDEPFFIMKYLEGDNLQQLIQKLNSNNLDYINEYGLDKKLDIFLKVCDAIAFAHSKGFVHLDIKPANIQIGKFGEVTVCDWGLARELEDLTENVLAQEQLKGKISTNTMYGSIKGSPGYMAPEQISSDYGARSEQTDIFSLGVLLYELLTLRRPFNGGELQNVLGTTLAGEFADPAEINPDLPNSLRAVIMKAMNTEQSKRYTTVLELAEEIRKYLRGFATNAENAGMLSLFKLMVKRHKKVIIVSLVFFILFNIQLLVSYVRVENEKLIAEAERDRAEESALFAKQAKEDESRAREIAEASEKKTSLVLEDLIEEQKKTETARAKMADLLYNNGLKFRNQGEYKKALRNTLDAYQLGKRDGDIELFLAGLYLGEWEFKKAKELYKTYNFASKNELYKILDEFTSYKKEDLPIELVLELVLKFEDLKFRIPKASVASHFLQTAAEYLSSEKRMLIADQYFKKKLKKNPLKKLAGGVLSLDFKGAQHIPDLNILYKMPVTEVDFSHSVIKDLEDLSSWPVEKLDLSYTTVNIANDLQKMNLKELNLEGTKIKGLSRINGDHLEVFNLPDAYNLLEELKDFPALKKLIVPSSVYGKRYILNLGLQAEIIDR